MVGSTGSGSKCQKTGRLSVLVVEDNSDFRDIYKGMIADEFALTFADDSESALKALKNDTFNLIILDLMLSDGVGGVDLSKKIMSDPRHSETPILFSSVQKKLPEDTPSKTHFICKPFTKEKITDKIIRLSAQSVLA